MLVNLRGRRVTGRRQAGARNANADWKNSSVQQRKRGLGQVGIMMHRIANGAADKRDIFGAGGQCLAGRRTGGTDGRAGIAVQGPNPFAQHRRKLTPFADVRLTAQCYDSKMLQYNAAA